MEQSPAPKAPWYFLALLILAGESVFILPFVLQRVFRPTVLETFELDNFQLGVCFSAYGVVALFSYLFGGPLADRFPPRKLMAVALWMTALGGLVYAQFPSFSVQKVLYGYWGFTTIFLFWAPMIKATRIWGGTKAQGRAFGLLDGGRGLVGALFGTLSVFVFSLFIAEEVVAPVLAETKSAFRQVILVASAIISVVGLLVWWLMRLPGQQEREVVLDKITISQIREVLKLPAVWLMMIIILSAYVSYKVTDIFSLYAKEVLGYDSVQSAQVGTLLLYVRPVVGISIGFLADRTQTTLWLFLSFVFAGIGALLFATGVVNPEATSWFFWSTLIVALGVYAARALYFAVMQAGRIPLVLTGTAVGLISIVGYTPDIFAGPAMGYLLDSSPGIEGHQHVFWMVVGFSCLGGVAAGIYHRKFST